MDKNNKRCREALVIWVSRPWTWFISRFWFVNVTVLFWSDALWGYDYERAPKSGRCRTKKFGPEMGKEVCLTVAHASRNRFSALRKLECEHAHCFVWRRVSSLWAGCGALIYLCLVSCHTPTCIKLCVRAEKICWDVFYDKAAENLHRGIEIWCGCLMTVPPTQIIRRLSLASCPKPISAASAAIQHSAFCILRTRNL